MNLMIMGKQLSRFEPSLTSRSRVSENVSNSMASTEMVMMTTTTRMCTKPLVNMIINHVTGITES